MNFIHIYSCICINGELARKKLRFLFGNGIRNSQITQFVSRLNSEEEKKRKNI